MYPAKSVGLEEEFKYSCIFRLDPTNLNLPYGSATKKIEWCHENLRLGTWHFEIVEIDRESRTVRQIRFGFSDKDTYLLFMLSV